MSADTTTALAALEAIRSHLEDDSGHLAATETLAGRAALLAGVLDRAITHRDVGHVTRRLAELRAERDSVVEPAQVDPNGYECTCEPYFEVIDDVAADELERPLRENEVDTSDCIVHNADANAREAKRLAAEKVR